jgi:hypothetical protein
MTCTNDCQRPTPTQAHCGACHRTFGAVSGFDRHRREGRCLDPAALGMAQAKRIWRQPLSAADASRLRLRGLRAESPSTGTRP